MKLMNLKLLTTLTSGWCSRVLGLHVLHAGQLTSCVEVHERVAQSWPRSYEGFGQQSLLRRHSEKPERRG